MVQKHLLTQVFLGRIAESYLEIVDYNDEGPITLPVYPTYEASTKTLNLSLN